MPASRKRRTARSQARQRPARERATRQNRAAPAEFLDGSDTLARWLLPRLQSADLIAVRTGWLSSAGIDAIFPALVRTLEGDGAVMIVANAPEDMTDAVAFSRLTELVARFPGQMAVVLTVDVFQHGKVYYIHGRDGREVAYVGSANLTGSGLARNHETGVAFSNGEPIIHQVRESVFAWWGHPAARWLDSSYLPGDAIRAADTPGWPAGIGYLEAGDRITVAGRPGVIIDAGHTGRSETFTVALDGDDGRQWEIRGELPPPQVTCPVCKAAAGKPCTYRDGGTRPRPHQRRETLEAEEYLRERLAAWIAPDGTILPPPGTWEAAGGYDGIRSQNCPRCAARPGSPCLNDTGGETAEHAERVTLALRARGRDDVAALCGGRTKRGRACREETLPDEVYCRTHRDKARRGLPV